MMHTRAQRTCAVFVKLLPTRSTAPACLLFAARLSRCQYHLPQKQGPPSLARPGIQQSGSIRDMNATKQGSTSKSSLEALMSQQVQQVLRSTQRVVCHGQRCTSTGRRMMQEQQHRQQQQHPYRCRLSEQQQQQQRLAAT